MHKTVLLNEAIDNLNVKEDGIYVDATLGFGGHSGLILKRVKRGFLFAFDQDIEAIKYSNKKLSEINDNFIIINDNFCNMKKYINKEVDGIMFDLGVSSPQLDEAERGFSFHKDAKLDMRMDTDQSFSAYDVVNDYSKEELETIFALRKTMSNMNTQEMTEQIMEQIVTTKSNAEFLERVNIFLKNNK